MKNLRHIDESHVATMNPPHLNYNHNHNQVSAFQHEKQKWESAIASYSGPDSLDLWYNFICWYEQNVTLDPECLFDTILGKCITLYEYQQHYYQDPRLVKLWMKYINRKPNPANSCNVLYQRGIGTECAILYIAWAHFCDTTKQSENVFTMGIQANAQPFNLLEQAHKKFRATMSQRIYNEQQTKKRTLSQMNEQRPPMAGMNSTDPAPVQNSYMTVAPVNAIGQQQNAYGTSPHMQPAQQQPQQLPAQHQVQQQQRQYQQYQHQQQPPQQHIQHQPHPQSQQHLMYQQQQQQQLHQQQQQQQQLLQQHPQHQQQPHQYPQLQQQQQMQYPQHQQHLQQAQRQSHSSQPLQHSQHPQQPTLPQQPQYPQHLQPPQPLQMPQPPQPLQTPQSLQPPQPPLPLQPPQLPQQLQSPQLPQQLQPQQLPQPPQPSSYPAYHANQTQPPNQYYNYAVNPEQPSAKRFRAMDDANAQPYNQTYAPPNSLPNTEPLPQPNIRAASEMNGCQYMASPTVDIDHQSIHSNSSPAYAIASSLQSVYSGDESDGYDAYGFNDCAPKAIAINSSYQSSPLAYSTPPTEYASMSAANDVSPTVPAKSSPGGINLPPNHCSYSRNHHIESNFVLYQDEPSNVPVSFRFPRHVIYPGNGCEYSMEEIRARNYTQLIESIKYRNRPLIDRQIAVVKRQQLEYDERKKRKQFEDEQHEQKRLQEEEQKRRIEEQERQKRLFEEQQRRIVQEQQERERLAEMERERVRKEQEQNRLAELERQRMQQMKQEQAYMHQLPAQQQPTNYPPNQMVHNQSYYAGDPSAATAYNTYGYPMAGQSHMNGSAHPLYRSQQSNAQPYFNQQSRPYNEQTVGHSSEMYKYPPQQLPSNQQQQPHPQQVSTHHQMQPHQPDMHMTQATPSQMQKPYQSPQQLPPNYGYQNNQYASPAYSNEYQYQPEQHPSVAQGAVTPNDNGNGYSSEANSSQEAVTPMINASQGYVDDIEEQIEASTIVLENGTAKPQKITIKYRKEKAETMMPSESTPKSKKSAKTKKPKKPSKQQERLPVIDDQSDEQSLPPIAFDDTFNESASNDSYATPNKTLTKSSKAASKSKKSKARKTPKFEASYLQNEESCSTSDFNTLYGKYSNEANDETITNGTARNVRFNFSGATSTPVANRNHNNNNNHLQSPCSSARATYKSNDSSSKSSTPRHTFRSIRKRASNLSMHNHTFNDNEDSMTSFSIVEPNSFFETENDDELRQQRLDKALKTIDTHFKKDFIDPFSSELCKALLTKADFPSHEHSEYYKLSNVLLSKLSNTKTIYIGDVRFNIEKEIGRGAYGSVYKGTNTNTSDVVALKYQKPPNTWELYICTEVTQRIKAKALLPGFMEISSAIIAPNASVFVTEFSQYGSLLDINNRIRQSTTKVMHESLVMHFTSQILSIIHHLHTCQIIHGDIKPDNFLLMKIPNTNSEVPTIRLIDFGCAIDMKFFKKGTQFKKIIQTDGFTCPEMQDGRSWSYQTDIFCIAGTVHVMLFGEYMQLVKKFDHNEIKQKLPRYLKKHIWTEFFSAFLNIKDVHNLPNMLKMKEAIDDELYGMESELQTQIRTLSNILHKR